MDILKTLLTSVATRLARKPFRLVYWDRDEKCFGSGSPEFTIAIRRPAVLAKILLAPDPYFGDAYVQGAVDIHPLPAFFDAYLSAPVKTPQWSLLQGIRQIIAQATPISQQYRDIQSHYDRGNAFFSLWLDRSRTYSCAYFRQSDLSLDEAQEAKIDHVLKKACLRPAQRLIDIGSGWGALIIKAAKRYGVRAHGITLSQQQYDYTRERIRQEGLQGCVSVEMKDYRQLTEEYAEAFDRVVSVGMMEHVGQRNLPLFLESVHRLLAPKGVCVLHSMTRIRQTPTSPWIRKHVFPGCYVPAWSEVVGLMPRFSFHLLDAESLRRHYARTLALWAERFEARLADVRRLGLDESFIRMWRFYLNACSASFKHGVLDLHQFVFSKGIHNELPMTREFLYQQGINSDQEIASVSMAGVAPSVAGHA